MARTGLSLFWRSSTWRLRYLRECIFDCSPLLMPGAEGMDFRNPVISVHFCSFGCGLVWAVWERMFYVAYGYGTGLRWVWQGVGAQQCAPTTGLGLRCAGFSRSIESRDGRRGWFRARAGFGLLGIRGSGVRLGEGVPHLLRGDQGHAPAGHPAGMAPVAAGDQHHHVAGGTDDRHHYVVL